MRFQVIIRGYNCEKFLSACLNSLLKQTHTNWIATIILDTSTDKSFKIAKRYAKKDKRINVFINKKRMGVAYNIVKGLKLANPLDSDIVAIYDSDDELYPKSFEIANKEYVKNPKLLLTYGSFWRMDKRRTTKTSKKGYKKGIPVRKQPWHGSHLKTFMFKAFKHVPESCFKDNNGKWLQAASDLALMFPLFEIVGFDRTKHIKALTYKWRRTCYKTRGHEQWKNMRMLRKRKPLERIEKI